MPRFTLCKSFFLHLFFKTIIRANLLIFLGVCVKKIDKKEKCVHSLKKLCSITLTMFLSVFPIFGHA